MKNSKLPKLTGPLPKKLGTLADQLYALKQARYALQAEAKKIKERELEIEDAVVNALPKSSATGVSGAVAKVSVTTKDVPVIEDKDELKKYVTRTKSWDLLSLRLNTRAVQERLDQGKAVKGVGTFTRVGVSCTKV